MRRRAGASELRAEIDRLPLATRQAMLKGIEANSIIVGADGNTRGGVCPVYAAAGAPSKRIGRPFARAWDGYAGARLSRPASERELRTLTSMLETSIELEMLETSGEPEADPKVFLGAAIAEHKASRERSVTVPPVREARAPAPRRDTGERDRTRELSRRPGWAWLRPFRRYDDYERALQTLEELESTARDACSEADLERPGSELVRSS